VFTEYQKVCQKPISLFSILVLTFTLFLVNGSHNVQVLVLSLIGNPVRIGDGPAAVVGDERRKRPLSGLVNSSLLIGGKARQVG